MKNIRKNKKAVWPKKAAVLTLSGMILIGNTAGVYAAEENSEKEEVVYIMTDAAGCMESINVVNIVGGGDITDYGTYEEVKNLSSPEEISYMNGVITFTSDEDKTYYQGTMDTDTPIPWSIEITYTLDGKDISPEDLAGKSGSLVIHISVTQNTECNSTFWENYALQAAVTLDTALADDITAEGATIANVGSDKQLSYIVLPGNGLDAEITAEVKDFEMEAITINGVRLGLDIDYDDTEMMEKVSEIQEAAEALNDGASELSDGSNDLSDGAASVNEGASDLADGIQTVSDAIDSINGASPELVNASEEILEALNTIQAALNQVSISADELYALSSASSQLLSSTEKLQQSLNITDAQRSIYAAYTADGNSAGSQTMAALSVNASDASVAVILSMYDPANAESMAKFQTLLADYISIAGKLINTEQLLAADIVYINSVQTLTENLGRLSDGMNSLKTGIDTLSEEYEKFDSGLNNYADAVSQLQSGYAQITSGASELLEGTEELYSGSTALSDGAAELSDGTEEFYEETSDMDTTISDMIEETIDSLTGSDAEVVSFVSEKNTNVTSVQFVIKTASITVDEKTENVEAEEESLNFLQKLLKLFGIISE